MTANPSRNMILCLKLISAEPTKELVRTYSVYISEKHELQLYTGGRLWFIWVGLLVHVKTMKKIFTVNITYFAHKIFVL